MRSRRKLEMLTTCWTAVLLILSMEVGLLLGKTIVPTTTTTSTATPPSSKHEAPIITATTTMPTTTTPDSNRTTPTSKFTGIAESTTSATSSTTTSEPAKPQPSPTFSSTSTTTGPSTTQGSTHTAPYTGNVPSTTTLPSNTPVPSPVFTGFAPTIAPSTPPSQVGLDIYHCQLRCGNDYNATLTASGKSKEAYAGDLGRIIAAAVNVEETRITECVLLSHPDTDELVVRFNVRPTVRRVKRNSCNGCNLTPSMIVDIMRNKTSQNQFNLTDSSVPPQILYTDTQPAFFAYTDTGPCPTDPCKSNSFCKVRPRGEFYCQCVSDCPPEIVVNDSGSNNKLWALLVIPIVLIIVLIVVVVVLIRLRLIKFPVKKPMKTVRNYRPTYDIGTIVDQPMVASVDPGAANRLYKTMGSTLGVAIHDKTFKQENNEGDDSSGNLTEGVAQPCGM